MIKKNIFTNDLKFPNLKTKEDFVLWLKFLKKNYKIFSINTDLTSWRKLNNSLSSSTLQKLIDGFNVYNKFMKFNFIKSLYYLIVLCANYLRK
jgi:teichuronic acid biosynthesis glycosyltransferase TuaG